jgi:type I restriction enzyme, S subunit
MTQTETIPTGYKKTEIGIIPEDWNVKTLVEVTENVKVGLATSVTRYYRNKGIPIIRNLNIKDGFFDDRDMLYLDEDFAKANLSKSAKGLDVLTVHTGANLGLTCVLPKRYDKCQTFTTLITTPKKSIIDSYYLCYHMGSFFGKKEMNKLEVGGGKGNLNTADLKKYRIFFPSNIKEQKAIAEVLSDTDALIESLEKLIAKKKAIKQGAMQQLLTGKKRLPGFSGEWKTMKLGQLVDYKNGKSFESHIVDNGDYYLITLNSLDITGKLRKDHLRVAFNDKSLNKNDLIMILSDVAHGYFLGLTDVIPEDNKYVLNQRVGALKNIRYVKPYYLSKYINIKQKYFKSIGQGSSQQNLNRDDILNFKIHFPIEISEQVTITSVILDIDAEIEKLEQKKDKYISLKQGMMQQLLTGKIRLVKNGDN